MSLEGIMANLSMEEILSNLTIVENITSGREGIAWKLKCDVKKDKEHPLKKLSHEMDSAFDDRQAQIGDGAISSIF